MTTFKTVEQITNKFIKDGWGKNTSFEEFHYNFSSKINSKYLLTLYPHCGNMYT